MKMNYFVFGTNDLGASKAFYDALFEKQGLHSFSPTDRMTYWMGEDFAFATATPFDTKPATHGNGTMVGFCVGAKDDVEELYERAIHLAAHAKARLTSGAQSFRPMSETLMETSCASLIEQIPKARHELPRGTEGTSLRHRPQKSPPFCNGGLLKR